MTALFQRPKKKRQENTALGSDTPILEDYRLNERDIATNDKPMLKSSVYNKTLRKKAQLHEVIMALLLNYQSDNCSCEIKLNLGGPVFNKKYIRLNGRVEVKNIDQILDTPNTKKSMATQTPSSNVCAPAYIPVPTGFAIVPDNLLHLNCQRDFVNMRASRDGSFITNTFLSNISTLDEHVKNGTVVKFIDGFNQVIRDYYTNKYRYDEKFIEYKCINRYNPCVLRSLRKANREEFFDYILKHAPEDTPVMSEQDQITADLLCSELDFMSLCRGIGDNSVQAAAIKHNVPLIKAYQLVRRNGYKKWAGVYLKPKCVYIYCVYNFYNITNIEKTIIRLGLKWFKIYFSKISDPYLVIYAIYRKTDF